MQKLHVTTNAEVFSIHECSRHSRHLAVLFTNKTSGEFLAFIYRGRRDGQCSLYVGSPDNKMELREDVAIGGELNDRGMTLTIKHIDTDSVEIVEVRKNDRTVNLKGSHQTWTRVNLRNYTLMIGPDATRLGVRKKR